MSRRKMRKAPPVADCASILALSGGGMRGLFTAVALQRLQQKGIDLVGRFNLLSGTSIGGILALGLAAGVKPSAMAAAIRAHGPSIFKRSLWQRLNNPKRVFAAAYRPEPLASAISAILGDAVSRPLADVRVPLVITAVELNRGIAKIFASAPVADEEDDLSVTLGDVALATSAAPTYFPPHRIGDRLYVDGGLIANSPDIVAVQRTRLHLQVAEQQISLLSVGTASYEKRGAPEINTSGGLAWMGRHGLFSLTLDAQADLSRAQAETFLGRQRFYRLDKKPEHPIELDDASERQMDLLTSLADEAVEAFQADGPAWRTYFQ